MTARSTKHIVAPDVFWLMPHAEFGFEQDGEFHSSAAQAKRYSFATLVVIEAEDHGVVEVSDSLYADLSKGALGSRPATSETAASIYVPLRLKFRVSVVAPPAVFLA